MRPREHLALLVPVALHGWLLARALILPESLHFGFGIALSAMLWLGVLIYAVENLFLNLDGMSDGSITVIDLKANTVLGNIDTLKAQGFNPNCIMLLPNHFQKGGLRASR